MRGQEKEHIRNLLTLRYDPMEKPFLRTTKYKDWKPMIYETTAITLESKLIASLSGLGEAKKIGIALSSGIDSVLLLKMLTTLYPDKEIIAFHYLGINDEFEDVKMFTESMGVKLVTINSKSLLDTLQWQVSLMEDPSWDAFDYVIYESAKSVGCDVIVEGTGADELFGGYMFRYNDFAPTDNSTEAKFYAYMDVHKRDWVEDQGHLFGPEIPFQWDMIKEHVIDSFGNSLETICQVFMADYNGKLAHLFAKKRAKYQKVFGLPIISPYLDMKVTEYGMRLEPSLKILGNVGKMPLRQIAARYDLACTTNKYGFSHDTVGEWNDPKYHDEAHQDITDPNNQMFIQGLISYDWVKRHTRSETDLKDVRYINKFYYLMALEQFLRRRYKMGY